LRFLRPLGRSYMVMKNYRLKLPVETTSEGGGDGGYGALNRKLESVKENEKLQIGIYDRDDAGLRKGFDKLNKNMVLVEGKDFLKKHKNNKSYALVLPPQEGLEKFVRHTNLPIEFLFSEEDLAKSDEEGFALRLIPYQHQLKFGNEVIETIRKTDIHLCTIDSNTKKRFAESVVKTFGEESFGKFIMIFDLIKEILNEVDTVK